ncbi:MAG: hypothetical protein R6U98_06880 [Pirellulaceae bacterium]
MSKRVLWLGRMGGLVVSLGVAVGQMVGCSCREDVLPNMGNKDARSGQKEVVNGSKSSSRDANTSRGEKAEDAAAHHAKTGNAGTAGGAEQGGEDASKALQGETSGDREKKDPRSWYGMVSSMLAGDGTPTKADDLTPQVARRRGKKLLAEAAEAADQGKSSEAFRAAVKAWRITRDFTDAPQCQRLAETALERAKTYGESTNQGLNEPIRARRTTVR